MNAMRKFAVAPLVLLAACTTIPTGPSVMALPGTGKTFDQFRVDDAECRNYALAQSGGTTASDAQAEATAKNAAAGAAIGALAGAIIGGHRSAGAGAGTGLIVGAAAGAGAGNRSGYGVQRRYDQAYVQCMYAKGERVPVSGTLTQAPPAPAAAPPAYAPPPPPPNTPAPQR